MLYNNTISLFILNGKKKRMSNIFKWILLPKSNVSNKNDVIAYDKALLLYLFWQHCHYLVLPWPLSWKSLMKFCFLYANFLLIWGRMQIDGTSPFILFPVDIGNTVSNSCVIIGFIQSCNGWKGSCLLM